MSKLKHKRRSQPRRHIDDRRSRAKREHSAMTSQDKLESWLRGRDASAVARPAYGAPGTTRT